MRSKIVLSVIVSSALLGCDGGTGEVAETVAECTFGRVSATYSLSRSEAEGGRIEYVADTGGSLLDPEFIGALTPEDQGTVVNHLVGCNVQDPESPVAKFSQCMLDLAPGDTSTNEVFLEMHYTPQCIVDGYQLGIVWYDPWSFPWWERGVQIFPNRSNASAGVIEILPQWAERPTGRVQVVALAYPVDTPYDITTFDHVSNALHPDMIPLGEVVFDIEDLY